MARALKTFRTTIGFFELAVAAPSMKAALEIWGAKSNLFQHGFAHETRDPEIIRVTMAKPGVVLRRAVGSHGAFTEHPDLPSVATLAKAMPPPAPTKKLQPSKVKRQTKTERPDAETRKAAQLYDLAQKRRERDEARAQAEFEKEQERRARAVEKAKAALDAARERHDERLAEIENERETLEREARAEEERWENEKAKLDAALEKARS